jgi:hypothetical protein
MAATIFGFHDDRGSIIARDDGAGHSPASADADALLLRCLSRPGLLRRLGIFGQRDKLKADRSKRGVRRGHKEEAAQRRIQGASGDDGAFGGEDPG